VKGVAVLLFIVVVRPCAYPQDSVQTVPHPIQVEGFSGRKVLATGLVGAFLAGSLVDSYYSWWKGASNPFTFHAEGWFNDGSKGIDKAGHIYTSYFYFNAVRDFMLWGGYEPSTALWWGIGLSGFFALSIEIGDGLSEYAFDYQDLMCNMVGLGYGVLQTKSPFLQNFNLKWSYVPRDGYRFPPHFTDHYDAHTYWITTNVHGLLPPSLKDYWPEFLQVAVGYGVDDNVSKREMVVGLDFNLEVFSISNQELSLAQKILNKFHFPAPGIKFTEQKTPRYYLFQRD
jgi:hypothetical protein